MILTALAGPASNLILGFLFAIMYKIYIVAMRGFTITSTQQGVIIMAISILFGYAISINTSLAIFNLFPVPPLDGSKILFSLLPYKVYYKYVMPYEKYINLAFTVLVILGVLSPVISWCSSHIINLYFIILGM